MPSHLSQIECHANLSDMAKDFVCKINRLSSWIMKQNCVKEYVYISDDTLTCETSIKTNNFESSI